MVKSKLPMAEKIEVGKKKTEVRKRRQKKEIGKRNTNV
jgi:hypothetical protein